MGSFFAIGGLWSALSSLLVPVLGTVATAVIGYASAYAAKHWKLQITASSQDTLHSAVETGISWALSKVGGVLSSTSVNVGSPLVADALQWVLTTGAPEALKQLGATPDDVRKLIVSKLQAMLGGPIVRPASAVVPSLVAALAA